MDTSVAAAVSTRGHETAAIAGCGRRWVHYLHAAIRSGRLLLASRESGMTIGAICGGTCSLRAARVVICNSGGRVTM
jgi:hypothetical protein